MNVINSLKLLVGAACVAALPLVGTAATFDLKACSDRLWSQGASCTTDTGDGKWHVDLPSVWKPKKNADESAPEVADAIRASTDDGIVAILNDEALLKKIAPDVKPEHLHTFVTKCVRLPDAKGGDFILSARYRAQHESGSSLWSNYIQVEPRGLPEKPGAEPAYTGKPFLLEMNMPDTGDDSEYWVLRQRPFKVPAGTEYLKIVLRFDGTGYAKYTDVGIARDEIGKRPDVEFNCSVYGDLDGRFAIGEGQVGLVHFDWRRSPASTCRWRDRVGELEVVVPEGFEIIDGNWTDFGKVKAARVRAVPTIRPVAGYNDSTRISALIRATSAVGAEGKLVVRAYAGKGEMVPIGEGAVTLFTVPKVIAPQPKRYLTGIFEDYEYWHFSTEAGREAYADLIRDVGVTWTIPRLDGFNGDRDYLRRYRSRGIRHITPFGVWLSDGYVVGRNWGETYPADARYVSDKKGDTEINMAVCPVAVYTGHAAVRTNFVEQLDRKIAGADGMWSNWEPYSFAEKGCFCTNCAKAFAAFLKRPETDILSDWPKCIRKGGRFYSQKNEFRTQEHGKLVQTVQKHVMAHSTGKVGFMPGICWAELSDYCHDHDYPAEVKQRAYATSLKWLNGWGPYVGWESRQGPVNAKVGLDASYWCAAKNVRETMTADYGAKCPKLVAFPAGLTWTINPEQLELAMDTFFFNGWEATVPWMFPIGADARHWKAFASATARAAKFEDFVLDGKRIDAAFEVACKPGTERYCTKPDSFFLPKVGKVLLVQHAAYELQGKRIVALFNYADAPAEVTVREHASGESRVMTLPALSCTVVECSSSLIYATIL